MKVKTRNIIELLLQGICALLLFIPGMYTKLTYAISIEGVRIADESNYSFFSRMDIDTAWPGWATLICAVIGLVVYIVQVVSNNKNRNLAFAAIVAPVELAFFILFHLLFSEGSIGAKGGYTYLYAYLAAWLFFVTAALLLTLSLLSIIGYFKANKLGIIEEQPATNNISSTGNADELRKLKSLLDCGAITEEEFQAKKAELLK